MRKGKYVLAIILFVLAVAIAGGCFYFYPTWRAAKILSEKMDFSSSSFVLEVELDSGVLPQEQEKMFSILARITGIAGESMYHLTITGEAQGDKVHMLIYPEGQPESLAEVYLSDDTSVINETMLYEAIRRHLADGFPFLGYLMPGQEETLYMTFEQVEQLFGADLSQVHGPVLPKGMEGLTTRQYFAMLAAMSREELEDGYRFGLEREQVELWFDLSGGKGDEAVGMGFSVESPSEVSAHGNEILAKLGMDMGEGDFPALERFSIVMEPGNGGEIRIPENLVNQKTIDILSEIRVWIEENIKIGTEDLTTVSSFAASGTEREG